MDRLEGMLAIIPTPANDDAARWDAQSTVDLDELERLVTALLADGADGLVALGTTGECATLTRAEWDQTVDCILSTVNGRVPTFIGATALGMHEIVDRTRFVRERGATGTLMGLPMWQPLTSTMAVKFYERLSEGFPDLQIMAYPNSRAFRFAFDADFWREVSMRAPTLTAAKFSKVDQFLNALEASQGRIQFIPHETKVLAFARQAVEVTTACWSTCASIGPAPALAIIQAILRRDWDRAEAIQADLDWVAEPIRPITADQQVFGQFNIQVEKARMRAGQYCRPGPVRPPYDELPEDYDKAATECGRRWHDLHMSYTSSVTA